MDALMTLSMDPVKEKKKKKKMKRKEEGAEEPVENMSILGAVGLFPKKKKKKKKNEDPVMEVVVDSYQIQNEEPLEEMKEGKKKKKKKRLIENTNEASLLPDTPKKRPLPDLAEPLPRKKRKGGASPKEIWKGGASPKESRDGEADKAKETDGGAGGSIWSREEELTVLQRIRSQLPKNDTKSCRVSLKDIDWKAVAFDSHSHEDCKRQFEMIFSKINVIKSLTTILEEAQEFVESSSKRRRIVRLPRHRFLSAYISANRKGLNGEKGETYLTLANEAWRNLPEEERAAYQLEYNEELKKLDLVDTPRIRARGKRTIKESAPISLPRSPWEIWRAEEKETRNGLKAIKGKKPYIKAAFANLKRQKKVHYISLALEELLTFQKKAEEYVKDHPDYKVSRQIGPVKEELKIYLEEKGMPVCPPTKPYLLYYQLQIEAGKIKEDKGTNKLMKAQSIFRALSESEKDRYRDSHTENMERYKKEFATWEKEQDEITLYARERFFAKTSILANPANRWKFHVPGVKAAKQVSIFGPGTFSNTVKFDMSCPKFHEEPQRAPRTPLSLFCLRMEDHPKRKSKSRLEWNKQCREYWAQLTKEQRQAYVERCTELRTKYEEQLLAYVRGMSKKIRKVYLGFHRATHCAYFRRDIFEELYPNDKFPVYITSPKKRRMEEDGTNCPADPACENPGVASDTCVDGKGEGQPDEPNGAPGRKVRKTINRGRVSVSRPSESEEESLFAPPVRKKADSVKEKEKLHKRGCRPSAEESSDSGAKFPSKLSLKGAKIAKGSATKEGKRNRLSSVKEEKLYKVKPHHSEEESSNDSGARLPSKVPQKGLKTVRGLTKSRGKPMKFELSSSSDEMDIDVRPAWESQVDTSTIKAVDDTSSGFSDSC